MDEAWLRQSSLDGLYIQGIEVENTPTLVRTWPPIGHEHVIPFTIGDGPNVVLDDIGVAKAFQVTFDCIAGGKLLSLTWRLPAESLMRREGRYYCPLVNASAAVALDGRVVAHMSWMTISKVLPSFAAEHAELVVGFVRIAGLDEAGNTVARSEWIPVRI
jgi:hypothetical protein